jgi:hypothetical protein
MSYHSMNDEATRLSITVIIAGRDAKLAKERERELVKRAELARARRRSWLLQNRFRRLPDSRNV